MLSENHIPVVIIHSNPTISICEVLGVFRNSGCVPYCVIFDERYQEALPDYKGLIVLTSPKEKINQTVCTFFLTHQELSQKKKPIVLYDDDKLITSEDVIQSLYFTQWEPKALHVFETQDLIHHGDTPKMLLMDRIVGSRIDDPSVFFWIIPPKAVRLLCEKKNPSRYFPLTWLHLCNENNIAIRSVSIEDSTNEGGHHRAISLFLILMYSLGVFLRFAVSSGAAALADTLVFFVLTRFPISNALALICSRVVSMSINYLLLRFAVFREKGNRIESLLAYIALVIFSGVIVWSIINFGVIRFGIDPIWMKFVAEGIMFFFNYFVSKNFIFRTRELPMVEDI